MFSTRNFCWTTCGMMPPIPVRHMTSERTSFLTSSRMAALSCTASTAPASVRIRKRRLWRDVGTIDAYWAANIDLTDVVPDLDIYDQDWPIWTYNEMTPPAKFVHDEDGRRGLAISSLVSAHASSPAPLCGGRCFRRRKGEFLLNRGICGRPPPRRHRPLGTVEKRRHRRRSQNS